MGVIPLEQVSYSSLSSLDPLGRLFRWKGKIYRGICPGSAETVRQLFASGCLDELARLGLFPWSRLTDHTLEGYSLIVEHEEIPLVVYPYEWTFDMLRDAATVALEVIEVSNRYGWDLSDIHPYNVVFRGGRPVYVDLGSFRPLPTGRERRKGSDYHRFIKAFWRPLSLWAGGDAFVAGSILASEEPYLPDLSWWLYRHSALRAISPRFSARWARRFDRWGQKGARVLHAVRFLQALPASVASRLPVELLSRSPALLRQKISRLKQPLPTQWDGYHAPLWQQDKMASSPRFDRLLAIIRSLDCESVTELAGNQGVFSLLIAATTQVRKLVCTDYSSSPINDFYHRSREVAPLLNGSYLQGAVLNFMSPKTLSGLEPPSARLRSDTVVALAVLHHLILSQNYHPREILPALAQYTRRYVIVEFMPLGMWTEKKSKPTPPWYTTDWFREHFTGVFDLITEEQLEPNRIVFVGQVKTASLRKELRREPAAVASASRDASVQVEERELAVR